MILFFVGFVKFRLGFFLFDLLFLLIIFVLLDGEELNFVKLLNLLLFLSLLLLFCFSIVYLLLVLVFFVKGEDFF